MGYVSWLGKYDEKDSVLTELLRKAGAVFYVKTSVPQTLMVCETVNNIIGRTTNLVPSLAVGLSKRLEDHVKVQQSCCAPRNTCLDLEPVREPPRGRTRVHNSSVATC